MKYLLLLVLCSEIGWSQLIINGVGNAASFEPGLPVGGSLAAVCVYGLSGQAGVTYAASSVPLPTTLAGVQVTVNGAPAPILAVDVTGQAGSCGEVTFQVPLERNATIPNGQADVGGTVTVTQATYSATLTPTPAPNWVGFFQDSSGRAVAQHAADYSAVSEANPATAGEWIVVYATGFTSWPEPPIGFPAPSQPLFIHNYGPSSSDPYLFLQAQAPIREVRSMRTRRPFRSHLKGSRRVRSGFSKSTCRCRLRRELGSCTCFSIVDLVGTAGSARCSGARRARRLSCRCVSGTS